MIIIPATVINHTNPLVSLTLADPGQPTYAAFLQSLGNFIYKIDELFLFSDNFKQITGAVKYNRYDATGKENIANITPAADPYQSTNGLYLSLTNYKESFILNGNSSLATTILPNTQVLVRFFCKRINNSYGLHQYNFEELEKIFIQDFYKVRKEYNKGVPKYVKNNLSALRLIPMDKLPFNGITEEENKEPAIILSFASVMLAFYIFSKE